MGWSEQAVVFVLCGGECLGSNHDHYTTAKGIILVGAIIGLPADEDGY